MEMFVGAEYEINVRKDRMAKSEIRFLVKDTASHDKKFKNCKRIVGET
jgi:hypothetical protein